MLSCGAEMKPFHKVHLDLLQNIEFGIMQCTERIRR